jgi:hypothetical protein
MDLSRQASQPIWAKTGVNLALDANQKLVERRYKGHKEIFTSLFFGASHGRFTTRIVCFVIEHCSLQMSQ